MEITPTIIAIATIVPPIIESLKDDPRLTFITPEDKGRIMAVSSLLTALGSIALGVQMGTVSTDSWVGLIEAGAHFGAAMGLSELFYRHVIKRFKQSEEVAIDPAMGEGDGI